MIAAAATLAAAAVVTLGGSAVATLELSARDALAPPLAPVSPALVVVARDAASEARLGGGAWDRAVLARAVGSVARAGAGSIMNSTVLPSASRRTRSASPCSIASHSSLNGMTCRSGAQRRVAVPSAAAGMRATIRPGGSPPATAASVTPNAKISTPSRRTTSGTRRTRPSSPAGASV